MKRVERTPTPLPEKVEAFFTFMKKREGIRLRRAQGEDRPWTDDPILAAWKFTNVKREHDRTSRELIKEFYQPHYDAPREQILLNCAIARYFGTVEFMRAIGWQTSFRPAHLKKVARDRAERGARVWTGAYVISSGNNEGPKEGTVVDIFLAEVWKQREELCYFDPKKRKIWVAWRPFVERLQLLPGFGGSGFMAKEVSLDTRYTGFWPYQPIDVDSWTPVGPGSKRGAGRIYGKSGGTKASLEDTLLCCQQLFAARKKYLPKNFVELELHDIQFQLCEFDKYERVRLGEGEPKARYRPQDQSYGEQLKLL